MTHRRRGPVERRALAERPNYPGRIIGGTAFLVLSATDALAEPRQRCEVLIERTVMPMSFNVALNINKLISAIELEWVPTEGEVEE